jgi:phospholipase C
LLKISNRSSKPFDVEVRDNGYRRKPVSKKIGAKQEVIMLLELQGSHAWYDFTVAVKGADMFLRRYAGKVETGREGTSDPAMGRDV